jgi:hypothetical protein
MKKHERNSPPDCLNCQAKTIIENKKSYYNDLRNSDGTIKARWNTLDKDENNISAVRKALLTMSGNSCVYCGKKILNNTMEVDHFLPKEEFPYLAYCWDNYLPACDKCNGRIKKAYVPPLIKDKIIIEDFLTETIKYDYIYDKTKILNEVLKDERLIEPTFDKIEDHLEFMPSSCSYKFKSNIGKITMNKFFRDTRMEEELVQISILVKRLVENGNGLDIIQMLINLQGYEFYYSSLYKYWTSILNLD